MRAATSHGYISTNKLNCSTQACPADGSKGPWRKNLDGSFDFVLTWATTIW
jgi:hypothetical protein